MVWAQHELASTSNILVRTLRFGLVQLNINVVLPISGYSLSYTNQKLDVVVDVDQLWAVHSNSRESYSALFVVIDWPSKKQSNQSVSEPMLRALSNGWSQRSRSSPYRAKMLEFVFNIF
ncbi:hypothetical protein BLOT_007741 [Blomia tropicalis]|nr:hypothetical protein BLOT_007741 [Blomia tropicalis]